MAEEFAIAQMPGHIIRRLHQRSVAVFQERTKAAGFDITSVQFAALSALAHTPGMDQATLAAMVAYDRATIGGVVARLEQRGLLVRRTDEVDRRARNLWLTDAGKATLADLTSVVEAVQPQILTGLTEGEVAELGRLMQKVLSQ